MLVCNAVDVSHGNIALAGVTITIQYGGVTQALVTDINGQAVFCGIPNGSVVSLAGAKSGYQTFNTSFSMNQPTQLQAVLML